MKKRFFLLVPMLLPLLILVLASFSPLSFAYDSTANRSTSSSPQADTANNQDVQTLEGDPIGKSVNLRLYVPELFEGYLGGVWDIAISNIMSFGPIVRLFVFGKYSGYAFGLNVNYSLSGDLFSDGWVLNPYVEYARTNYEQPFDASGVRKKKGTGVVGANMLYEWIWNSGFNVMVGLGLEYARERIPVTSMGKSDFHPTFEFTLGYAF